MDISKITSIEVVEYLRENIELKEKKILDKDFYQKMITLEAYAKENYVPIIQKESLDTVSFFLKERKAENILELGTAIGYSSIFFAKMLNFNTHIDTMERNTEMIKLAKENIARFKLEDCINIIEGEIEDNLKILQKENKFYDLIFIDAGKSHYDNYLKYSLSLLNGDGLIICDNVLFDGKVANKTIEDKKNRTIIQKMKKFIEGVYADTSLESTLLPVGDGLLLIRKKGK